MSSRSPVDRRVSIRESREGLPHARHSEPPPRGGVFGSLRDAFRAGKRVHRVKSNRGLVRNTQALQSSKHIVTVSEKHEEDRNKPHPASNSNVEKFAYRASENTLLSRSAAELTGALLSLRAENRKLRQACAGHTKESQLVSSIREQLAQQEKELALAQEESARAHTELASVKRKAMRSLAQSAKSDPYHLTMST
ncbi:MAG: hypothetical protein M1840_002259 [Geoglossum simile]|nr:MAG: hypothetical protein M1840_002259 [Geoglossum simile]